MKKGLIIVNAYYNPPSYYNQANRLKQEFALCGVEIDILKNDFFPTIIDSSGDLQLFIANYDFCIYLDKDKYVSSMLEKSGVKLFNSHEAIRLCDDKIETFIHLANSGIKVPKTLSGLLCYDKNSEISIDTVKKIENHLTYPIVVKECFGSLGKNVYLAKDRVQLLDLMNKLKLKPHLFQEFVKSSAGKDVRVIVIGGEKVFSMLRESKSDFRSNVELGGKAYNYELSSKWREFAIKIAKLLKLDYCGIDLLFCEDGSPILCEVNSNAFFGGIEAITGENIARCYVDYIINNIYRIGE